MKRNLVSIMMTLAAFWLPVACPGNAVADAPTTSPAAVEGVLDLGSWQTERYGPLSLGGQWAFYWKQLLSPGDFQGPVEPPRTGWFEMPGVWNGITVDGSRLDGKGYATFRLRIRFGPESGRQALLIPYAFTAYRLWIDDRPAVAVGRVGMRADSMIPKYRTRVAFFDPGADRSAVLTLQVSNFMHAKGGMRGPIRLVAAGQVSGYKHKALIKDVLVFGCLLITSIYHLVLFVYRRVDRFNLYFAMCCLVFAVRSALTGEVFLADLFADLDWRLTVRLEWLCVYVGGPLGLAFVRSLFPDECPTRIYGLSLIAGAILGGVTLLAPPSVFTGIFPYVTPLIGLILAYTAWVLVRAALRRRFGAVVMLICLAGVIVTVANDILYANDLIQTGYYIPYGMLFFVFSQAMILANRSARVFLRLEMTNAAYADEIVERERAQAEVKAYRDALEVRVRDRTEALAVANRRLQRELDDRKAAEKEKSKLQERLQRAQKMEALGTLAGGVAHDLNNILSGVVGYPDLLLRGLSPDSELRKPLLTIQQSGLKAAAIVQDLLTLARRGVAEFEVLDLNRIVEDYLDSPEFHKLIQFHPAVTIATELAADLRPMKGAAVHLQKTLMNLVSNAAEAMPDGGTVRICTHNRTIERALDASVHPGDYIRLRVVDTGIGISEEDMARIFEPFYTKKVMGKSGTGLGMAVVWGTVQDHHGTIDTRSREGAGTTFDLYFPATDESLASLNGHRSLEDHRGQGERILVVDDVIEQRDIATAMLTDIGYHVASVDSGEAAVDHVARQPVDLLFLDMIMDPGIDGLETYRRILAIRPGQKALIVSGYAETARVREALAIGPSGLLKKPYRLDDLAEAVKSALA